MLHSNLIGNCLSPAPLSSPNNFHPGRSPQRNKAILGVEAPKLLIVFRFHKESGKNRSKTTRGAYFKVHDAERYFNFLDVEAHCPRDMKKVNSFVKRDTLLSHYISQLSACFL